MPASDSAQRSRSPAAHATTLVPSARASRTTVGAPSVADGWTSTSAAAIHASASDLGSAPVDVTSTPLRAASGKWLIVTGDRHFGQISEIKGVLRYPLVEVMASGMNTVWEEGAQEPDRYRVGQTVADINFGLLRINAKAARVAYSVHGGDGRAQLAGELEF